MALPVLKARYENKYRLDGIEFPVHCLFLHEEKRETAAIRPHYHEYIEILYSIESDCEVYINGKLRDFKTGDLLVVNSGESHQLLYQKGEGHYIVIKVLPEILYSSEQSVFEIKYTIPFLVGDVNNKRHFTAQEQGSSYIKDTVERIMNEWDNREYGFELSIRADILKLFLWMLRYWYKHDMDAVNLFDYSDEILRIIQRALEYTAANYAEITVKDAAAHCNLSYSYFSRMFKKVMHQSFTDYLTRYRITKAEQLLVATDKPVSVIAEEVGFSTPSYFIQQFKAHKNISPKQYKLNYTR